MNPRIWGKSLWALLFDICLKYPERPSFDDTHHMRRLIFSFSNVLPCYSCQFNFLKHLNEYPIDNYLSNRLSVCQYIYKIYCIVTLEQGRVKPTFESFVNKNYQELSNNFFEKSIGFIVTGYPVNPSFDHVQNYRKFFQYLNIYYPVKNYIPIENYLSSTESLKKWAEYSYNLDSTSTGSIEGFQSGNNKQSKSLALIGISIALVSYSFLK